MIDGEVIKETALTKPVFEMDVEVKIPDNIPQVEHNLDKLKEYAINLNDFYSKLVITEKDIKDAESEKAKLNKLIDQVKRLRIDNVKSYKKPIEDFEQTAKEVESILSNASNTIKLTLDNFDAQRIEEKRNKCVKPTLNNIISQAFINGHLINPDDIIENPKWYNKTFKDEDIEKEIQDQVDEIIRQQDELEKGIEVIKSNIAMANNPNLNEAMYIERFKFSKDLTAVLGDIARDNSIKLVISQSDSELIAKPSEFWDYTSNATITFRGTPDMIESIRVYAKEMGLEEVI